MSDAIPLTIRDAEWRDMWRRVIVETPAVKSARLPGKVKR